MPDETTIETPTVTPRPPTPAPAPPASTTTLEPKYPVTRFEHGVEGADPLEAGGTPVPTGLVAEIEAAARKAGVALVEVVEKDVHALEQIGERAVREVTRLVP